MNMMRYFALSLLLCSCISVNESSDSFARLRNKQESLCEEAPVIEGAEECRVALHSFSGLPVVNITAENRTLALLVDSGSPFCMIRPGVVEALNLPVAGDIRLSLLGETTDTLMTCFHRFTLGSFLCRHIRFVVTPGYLTREVFGIPLQQLDGVLGTSFLRRFSITMDFERKEVSLGKKGSLALPPGHHRCSIPLTLLPDGRPAVKVGFPNHEPVLFLLDTGSSKTVIHKAFAERLGLPEKGSARLLSFGIETEAVITHLLGMRIGAFTPETSIAYILPHKSTVFRRFEGILGIDTLKDFIITLDLPRGQLVLSARSP